MVELEKEDYNSYKARKYEKAILIQCKKCGECQEVKNIKNTWRGFCKTCKIIIVGDYKLTANAKKISWKDFEFYLGTKKIKEKLYNENAFKS